MSNKENKSNILLHIIIVLLIIIIWLISYVFIFKSDNNSLGSKRNMISSEFIPDNSIRWDYDGDWLIEDMRVTTYLDEENMDWICYINFSNQDIPTIPVQNCFGAQEFKNEWDLNWDSSDEIWFTAALLASCRRTYNVLTYKDWKWIDLVEPISTHCNQREECYNVRFDTCDWIKSFNKWQVQIFSSVLTDDWIFWKTEIIDLDS